MTHRQRDRATIKHVEFGEPPLLCVECRVPLKGAFYDIYVHNRAGEVVCYGCVFADYQEAIWGPSTLKPGLVVLGEEGAP